MLYQIPNNYDKKTNNTLEVHTYRNSVFQRKALKSLSGLNFVLENLRRRSGALDQTTVGPAAVSAEQSVAARLHRRSFVHRHEEGTRSLPGRAAHGTARVTFPADHAPPRPASSTVPSRHRLSGSTLSTIINDNES